MGRELVSSVKSITHTLPSLRVHIINQNPSEIIVLSCLLYIKEMNSFNTNHYETGISAQTSSARLPTRKASKDENSSGCPTLILGVSCVVAQIVSYRIDPFKTFLDGESGNVGLIFFSGPPLFLAGAYGIPSLYLGCHSCPWSSSALCCSLLLLCSTARSTCSHAHSHRSSAPPLYPL